MPVFRIERTKNYTIMSNYHLRDSRISLSAKGLLSQMLSPGKLGLHPLRPTSHQQGRQGRHPLQPAGAGTSWVSSQEPDQSVQRSLQQE